MRRPASAGSVTRAAMRALDADGREAHGSGEAKPVTDCGRSNDGVTRSSDRSTKRAGGRACKKGHDKAEQCERVHHRQKTKRRRKGSRPAPGTIRGWLRSIAGRAESWRPCASAPKPRGGRVPTPAAGLFCGVLVGQVDREGRSPSCPAEAYGRAPMSAPSAALGR
jgi:hypothetical protein